MDAARHVQGIRTVAPKPGGFTSLCGPAFGLLLCTETQPETLVGSFQTWVIIAALAKITAGFFSNFPHFCVFSVPSFKSSYRESICVCVLGACGHTVANWLLRSRMYSCCPFTVQSMEGPGTSEQYSPTCQTSKADVAGALPDSGKSRPFPPVEQHETFFCLPSNEINITGFSKIRLGPS